MYFPSILFSLAVIEAVSARQHGAHHSQLFNQLPLQDSETANTSSNVLPMSTRAHWMRVASSANLAISVCPFAPYGTAIVNHTLSFSNSSELGDLICTGVNDNHQSGNPTLHGEMAAFKNCSRILTDPEGKFGLSAQEALEAWKGFSLYTTAEPCPMCAGAIAWAGLKEVFLIQKPSVDGAMSASAGVDPKPPRQPKFPTHNSPRVWFLTSANSPVGISLARHLLDHGDYIVAGVPPLEFEKNAEQSTHFRDFLDEVKEQETWSGRLRVVGLDVRIMGQCQSAIAEAVHSFGRIDILFCCTSETLIGTVEELSQTTRTHSLIRDQFETNFFGPVNVIKSILPTFRTKRNGHIVMLSNLSGHMGTPGMSIYCASQWAIEGYCDSLAYEVAPFNIKMTIIQPNMEIAVLTNRITAAPPMPAYAADQNPAPLFRDILAGMLDRLEGSDEPTTGDQLQSDTINTIYAPLTKGMKESLVAETVHAVAAIGGHDNPPARHIVGLEGTATVKEKLKTVSEELEDFVASSAAVDIDKHEDPNLQQNHQT
ncbi:NAD(P)-binding protein, partial [Aureobasidium melanogenum]